MQINLYFSYNFCNFYKDVRKILEVAFYGLVNNVILTYANPSFYVFVSLVFSHE